MLFTRICFKNCRQAIFSTHTKITSNITYRTYTTKCSEALIKFNTVYSLPEIKVISTVNNLKKYQYAATIACLPSVAILEHVHSMPAQSSIAVAILGLSLSGLLTLFSKLTKNLIGFLYISEDNKYVKLSYADFWGRRKDKVVEVSQWIPLTEIPARYTDALYSTVKVDGTDEEFKLFLKYGKNVNHSKIGQLLE